MTYASQADLVERFGEQMIIDLSDRADPPADAIDAAVVARALTDADAVINGYLTARYALPLASTPALVRDLALPIACYKLHRDTVSAKVLKDYDDALKELVKIASGTIKLDVAGMEPATNNASGVRFTDRERPLTADNLKGYV